MHRRDTFGSHVVEDQAGHPIDGGLYSVKENYGTTWCIYKVLLLLTASEPWLVLPNYFTRIKINDISYSTTTFD